MNEWQEQAACRDPQVDPAIFFPVKGGDNGRAALRVCADCPVKAACLEFALDTDDSWRSGVYGGTTPNQRQRIADSRAQEPRAQVAA